MEYRQVKRYGHLWEKVCSDENIDKAIRLTFRGKRKYSEFKTIEKNLPYYRDQLQKMLINETYEFGEYRPKPIYEPKRRTALVARTFPDRFIHHAVVNVLEPIWSARTYYHSYACIKGKGTHAAHKAIAGIIAGYNFIVHLDLHHYYASIDHDKLKAAVRRKIKDKKLLKCLDTIIDTYPDPVGIPLGNATSPWFGNIFLWSVDEYITQEIKLPYVRYNDDMVIGADTREEIEQARRSVIDYVYNNFGIEFSKSYIHNTRQGITAIGYHSYRNKKRDTITILKKGTARKIRDFMEREAIGDNLRTVKRANKVLRVMTSYDGIMKQCSCARFRRKINFDAKYELFKIKGHEMIKSISEYYNGNAAGEDIRIENIAGLQIYICGIQQTKNSYYKESMITAPDGTQIKQTNGKNPTLSVIQFYIAGRERGKSEEEIRRSGKLYKVLSSAYSITNACEAMKDIDFKENLVSAMFTKSGKHPEIVNYDAEYAKKKNINEPCVLAQLAHIEAAIIPSA